jgi:two-component system, LytTR family, response regulator
MLRAIIVDDEPLSRDRIRELLEEHADITVVAECENGVEAVESIAGYAPDLVFLDIQMPGMTGLDVVRAVGPDQMPATVFITAYDEYAVDAFEANAIDYLLKPVGRERFSHAVERAVSRTSAASASVENERLSRLIAGLQEQQQSYPERIVVRTGTRLRLLPAADVDWIQSEGNYVRLHVGQNSYLLREKISDIEKRLDPRLYMRIHRSTMVNIERVVQAEVLFRGEYLLILRDGTKLTSSRSYRSNVQTLLGSGQD